MWTRLNFQNKRVMIYSTFKRASSKGTWICIKTLCDLSRSIKALQSPLNWYPEFIWFIKVFQDPSCPSNSCDDFPGVGGWHGGMTTRWVNFSVQHRTDKKGHKFTWRRGYTLKSFWRKSFYKLDGRIKGAGEGLLRTVSLNVMNQLVKEYYIVVRSST